MTITHRFTDPDGDHAGTLTIEARTYGPHLAYSLGVGTEMGSAYVITTLCDLVALRSALDEFITTEAAR